MVVCALSLKVFVLLAELTVSFKIPLKVRYEMGVNAANVSCMYPIVKLLSGGDLLLLLPS